MDFEQLIKFFSPKWAAERLAYLKTLELQEKQKPQQTRADRRIQASGYQAAITGRTTSPYTRSESLTGIPSLDLPTQRNIRDRARQQCRDNPIAASMLSVAADNIVGNGFRHQAQSADDNWNKLADAAFAEWTTTADYKGLSWGQHQTIVVKSFMRDGDVAIAKLTKGQVQIIESDYLSSDPRDVYGWYHDGIQLDDQGRTKSYTIMTFVDGKKQTWKQISPRNLIFLANYTRATQYRGESFFAPSLDALDQVHRYTDAVVLAQQIAACLAIFITKENPAGSISGLGTVPNNQGQQQKALQLEPGMIQALQNGESIEQINPSQPGASFEGNLRMLIRLLGLPFGLPIELVLMDFSQTNNASAKASILQAQLRFESIQKLLIDVYYSPLYRWVIDGLIAQGKLEDRPDKHKHIFHAPPWSYLDPVKELQATQLELDIGLSNLRRAATARGINYDQLIAENAAIHAQKKVLGLPLLHSSYVQELGTKVPTVNDPSDLQGDGTQQSASSPPAAITENERD